jgi:hypothetical protein
MTSFVRKMAIACGLLAAVVSAGAAQAATVLKTYNLEVYKGGNLVLSGTFSVNVEADTANVSVYNQQATLQSANLTLGSTTFSLANGNIGLFRNSSPTGYDQLYLYNLYGIAGGTGVGNLLDDFSFQFNPYNGTFGSNLYFHIAGGAAATWADRTVLTESGVPEPASWALMIIGFGLAGTGMRRRTRTAVQFA